MSLTAHDNLVYFRNGGMLSKYVFGASGMAPVALPAIVLINPKYPHNVGGAVRAAACYGLGAVAMTGQRVSSGGLGWRLPREERMRDYASVTLYEYPKPLDLFGGRAVPVAVEVRDNAESLFEFEHPENAVYVFGPEDGDLNRAILTRCHRFVYVPTARDRSGRRMPLNLASTIGTVLYDRAAKETR